MKISGSGILNFGKHRGMSVSSPEVPLDYLLWVQDYIYLNTNEEKVLEEEIEQRRNPGRQQQFTGNGFGESRSRPGASGSHSQNTSYSQKASTPPPPKAPRNLSSNMMLKVVAAGRKALALKHHPDAGGDPADMVAINNAADYLETVARGIAT